VYVRLFHAGVFGSLEERVKVCIVRMDASVRDEAEEVQTAIAFCSGLKGIDDSFLFCKFALFDELIDADEILPDYSASSDVQVSHLGLSVPRDVRWEASYLPNCPLVRREVPRRGHGLQAHRRGTPSRICPWQEFLHCQLRPPLDSHPEDKFPNLFSVGRLNQLRGSSTVNTDETNFFLYLYHCGAVGKGIGMIDWGRIERPSGSVS